MGTGRQEEDYGRGVIYQGGRRPFSRFFFHPRRHEASVHRPCMSASSGGRNCFGRAIESRLLLGFTHRRLSFGCIWPRPQP